MLNNSTVTRNEAPNGGGLAARTDATLIKLSNTIVAGNTDTNQADGNFPDCFDLDATSRRRHSLLLGGRVYRPHGTHPERLYAERRRQLYVACDLDGEGLQAWFDREEEAFRPDANPDLSRAELTDLIEASAVLADREWVERHSEGLTEALISGDC